MQVDFAPEHRRELVLYIDECKPRNMTGLELDEHVDVAGRSEIVAQHRAEQGEASDMPSTAELGDPLRIDCNPGRHEQNPTRCGNWPLVMECTLRYVPVQAVEPRASAFCGRGVLQRTRRYSDLASTQRSLSLAAASLRNASVRQRLCSDRTAGHVLACRTNNSRPASRSSRARAFRHRLQSMSG